MIWYVCLLLAIILIVGSVRILLDRSKGRLRAGLTVLGMALATFIIYIPVFFQLYDFFTAIFGNIINVLQVVSLDADYSAYYDMIMEGIRLEPVARSYMIILGALHFLMPALSILAAYNIFIHYYAGLQILFMNRRNCPLYIFSDCNDDSIYLARSIREKIKKCDLLFADRQETEEFEDRVDSLHAILYHGSIQDLRISRKKDKEVYYFCMEEDDEDLNNALHLIEYYADRDKSEQKKTHIFVLSEQKDVDIMLDSTNKGLTDVQVVNIPERVAYALLDEHPLVDQIKDHQLTILLAGLGTVNVELMRAIAWCGQMGDYAKLKICAIGLNTEAIERKLRYYYPDLFTEQFDVNLINCHNEGEMFEAIKTRCLDARYISVDMGDDSLSLETSLELRRLFYLADKTFTNAPPIFTLICDVEKKSMVAALKTPDTRYSRRVSYNIIPFGDKKTVLSYDNLIQEPLDRLAKNVHLVYSDIFSDGPINVEEALEQYNLLEVNKRSNRANAMHIRYKLALLGLDYTDKDNVAEVRLEDYLTEDKLEILTKAEHDRWMAFLQSEGWTTASLEQVEAYKASGLSAGRHNCALMKMHPYICDFDDLPARSEALGLPDSTVYDRDLITRIPDILHDKWNISDRKYKIIKR